MTSRRQNIRDVVGWVISRKHEWRNHVDSGSEIIAKWRKENHKLFEHPSTTKEMVAKLDVSFPLYSIITYKQTKIRKNEEINIGLCLAN